MDLNSKQLGLLGELMGIIVQLEDTNLPPRVLECCQEAACVARRFGVVEACKVSAKARGMIVCLSDDMEEIEKIVQAMEKCDHKWRFEPETPTASDVRGTIASLTASLNTELLKNPYVNHYSCSTGGISVSYTRWPSGSEEVKLEYSPVVRSRTA